MTFSRTLLMASALAFVPMLCAHAQESLLWKVNSRYQPAVVPPYMGQESPFPMAAAATEQVSETLQDSEALEQLEARQQTIDAATQLIQSPRAFRPFLDGMTVGGMVEGLNGRKVLVGNDWVGVGMPLMVRLVVSQDARDAIAEVEGLDTEMAQQLRQQLEQRLAQMSTTSLKLSEIRQDSLVLEGAYGRQTLPFHMEQ